MSDRVGGRNGVVAAGAGGAEASSSVVAAGTFVGTGGETFLAAGGVVGAGSSSAKGRGDVSDAGTAAARTPSAPVPRGAHRVHARGRGERFAVGLQLGPDAHARV